MLGIDLVVPIALNNLSSPLGSFLSTFRKPVKSHHNQSILI